MKASNGVSIKCLRVTTRVRGRERVHASTQGIYSMWFDSEGCEPKLWGQSLREMRNHTYTHHELGLFPAQTVVNVL